MSLNTDKDVVRTDCTIEFFSRQSMNAQLHNRSDLQRENSVIDSHPHLFKLRSVLMTYCAVDFEIGYVQGMNDLVVVFITFRRHLLWRRLMMSMQRIAALEDS